ncbi:MAG: apolipoprotein N-acyltransferase [Gammaproteobacteria bacterium]
MWKAIPGGLICLAAGVALPFAFSPYDLHFLALLSSALLFHAWLKSGPSQAFVYGYLFGLGMFGAGVNWLHISINLFGGVSLAGSLALTFALVAFLALYPALVGYLARTIPARSEFSLLTGMVPALWVLAEWVRTWALTGFPWLHLGYSLTDTPLAGLAPVTGVFGLSWGLTAMAGGLVALPVSRRGGRIAVAAGIAALVTAGWAAGKHDWTRSTEPGLPATVVQGAVPQDMKWRAEFREQALDRYGSLTEPHWHSRIIVWPETAIPAFPHQVEGFLAQLKIRAEANGTDLYVGLPVSSKDGNRYYNSVVLLNSTGGVYNKRHLVPFGEYLPMKPLLGDLVGFLQIPMSDFSPGGRDQALLTGKHAVAGVSICYEDTFGEEVMRALPEAQILINVSNDAWFGDSAAPHQHLQMARMRSLETGRYLLRATNTGVSAIIDQKGVIVRRSAQFQPATISAEVKLYEGLTPYASTGNLPVIIAALLTLLLSASLRRGKRD